VGRRTVGAGCWQFGLWNGFNAGQSTQEPLNYVVGGQWDINRSFSVLAELGFGERKSEMLNLTYRF